MMPPSLPRGPLRAAFLTRCSLRCWPRPPACSCHQSRSMCRYGDKPPCSASHCAFIMS